MRNIGLLLLAVSGSIMTAPIALPAAVVTIAGYAAVAGSVMSAVSQVTVEDKSKDSSGSAKGSCNALGFDPDIYRE